MTQRETSTCSKSSMRNVGSSNFDVHHCAFTLMEIILAVSIAGALLAAAATLVVSVSELWIERQDRHFFDDHVDGVTEFIQASFAHSGTEITVSAPEEQSVNSSNSVGTGGNTPNTNITETEIIPSNNGVQSGNITSEHGGVGLIKTAEQPIVWSKPPGYPEYEDPLLHFSLKDTSPLLIKADDAPVIGVKAFFYFKKDEGLSLLWYTPLQEDSEDLNDLRRTQISDLITQIEYIYWDDRFEKWENQTDPKESEAGDEFILPRFAKLTFEYEGEKKERILTIPVPSQSTLIF